MYVIHPTPTDAQKSHPQPQTPTGTTDVDGAQWPAFSDLTLPDFPTPPSPKITILYTRNPLRVVNGLVCCFDVSPLSTLAGLYSIDWARFFLRAVQPEKSPAIAFLVLALADDSFRHSFTSSLETRTLPSHWINGNHTSRFRPETQHPTVKFFTSVSTGTHFPTKATYCTAQDFRCKPGKKFRCVFHLRTLFW